MSKVSDKHNHIDKITHLTPEMMQRYTQGKLSPAEQHAVEKYLLDNPFEAEAMEGIIGNEFLGDVTALQSIITERTSQKETKVIPLWKRYYGIAAAIAVITVSSFLIVNLFESEKAEQEQLAMKDILEESSQENSFDTVETIQEEILIETELEKPDVREAETQIINEKESSLVITQTDYDLDSGGKNNQEEASRIAVDEMLALSDDVLETETIEMAEEVMVEVIDTELEEKPQFVSQNKTDIAKKSLPTRASAKQKSNITSKKERNERTVRGQITSIEDGMPLPGVNVVVKGTTIGTITDIDGYYEIAMNEEDVLVYSFVGYTSEEIDGDDKTVIDISMYADVAQLSEVIVTGYGTETEVQPYKSARPSVGYYSYRKYLKEQLIYPQHALDSAITGKVVVEFEVTTSGALKNFDVRKRLGFGCDEEAIRLIKEGPRWKAAEENGTPITKTVRIKVKFE